MTKTKIAHEKIRKYKLTFKHLDRHLNEFTWRLTKAYGKGVDDLNALFEKEEFDRNDIGKIVYSIQELREDLWQTASYLHMCSALSSQLDPKILSLSQKEMSIDIPNNIEKELREWFTEREAQKKALQ